MIPRFVCKAKAVSRRDDRLMSISRAGHVDLTWNFEHFVDDVH